MNWSKLNSTLTPNPLPKSAPNICHFRPSSYSNGLNGKAPSFKHSSLNKFSKSRKKESTREMRRAIKWQLPLHSIDPDK